MKTNQPTYTWKFENAYSGVPMHKLFCDRKWTKAGIVVEDRESGTIYVPFDDGTILGEFTDLRTAKNAVIRSILNLVF
jgi:hypothetical protein